MSRKSSKFSFQETLEKFIRIGIKPVFRHEKSHLAYLIAPINLKIGLKKWARIDFLKTNLVRRGYVKTKEE